MKPLTNSGIGSYLDEKTGRVTFDSDYCFASYGRKHAKDMSKVLCPPPLSIEHEPIYDVYRKIANKEHVNLFETMEYNYDFTVLMPNINGTECRKTSGHYHGCLPESEIAYPEVYEVIKGKVLYIMQKLSDNGEDIEDILIAQVDEGNSIIIPPNYGHCSVNLNNSISIFSSLAYGRCPVIYDQVEKMHGLSYYVFCENGKINLVKNENYTNCPDAKWISFKDNDFLGIKSGNPIYHHFINNPKTYYYLEDPSGFAKEIFSSINYL